MKSLPAKFPHLAAGLPLQDSHGTPEDGKNQ